MDKLKGILLLAALLLALGLGARRAQAQTDGVIRGIIYEDVDQNGICANTGEPELGNITVQLNGEAGETITVVSGGDGVFLATGLAYGIWDVTVRPGPEWQLISAQTETVELTAAEPEAVDLSFCLARVEATPSPSPTTGAATPATTPAATPVATPTSQPQQPVLPESGAPLAPSLLVAAVAGLALIVAGGWMLARRSS